MSTTLRRVSRRRDVSRPQERPLIRPPAGWAWWAALLASTALLGLFLVSVGVLFYWGVGVWGNNIPVTWALDIIGYDWWVGISTGALLVAGLMVLLRAPVRDALQRAAETTAVFAVVAAGIYPIIHLGRPWFFYWNLPYPNLLTLWPQWRSPLVWDAMAIVSELLIALSFWYVGLLPDLALLRDRSQGWWAARIYGVAAIGWRGSAMHWARWVEARRVQALFAVLVVVSLQTGAAVMFAGTAEPGWHDTIQPLLFLASAIMSGIAAVALLAILARVLLDLRAQVTRRHLDMLGGWLLAAGLAVTYGYAFEAFVTAYGGDRFELSVLARRAEGPYAWSYWLVVATALLPIHLLWFRALRRSTFVLAGVAALSLVGMWMDHLVVIVITLHRDFLPSSEHPWSASFWSIATFFGTFGLFGVPLLLFLRFVPVLSASESRMVAAEARDV